MNYIKIMFFSLLLASSVAHAELVVIVNESNNSTIEETTVSNIFLGKAKSFSTGSKAIPVILDYSDPSMESFLNKHANKTSSQFRAYWAKLVFSGVGSAPQIAKSSQEVVELVANNPNLIGVADLAKVTGKVKVIKLQ